MKLITFPTLRSHCLEQILKSLFSFKIEWYMNNNNTLRQNLVCSAKCSSKKIYKAKKQTSG